MNCVLIVQVLQDIYHLEFGFFKLLLYLVSNNLLLQYI